MKPIRSFLSGRKRLITAGIVILLILIVSIRLLNRKTQSPTYQTANVQRGTLITSVSASGSISSGNSVNVTSQATGVIKSVYVKNGEKISKGQKIADITLDQDSQQKQVNAWSAYLQAKNNLASAQAKINSLQAAEFAANQKFINDAVARNLATSDPTYIQENANWLQSQADYQNQSGVIDQSQAALSSAWLSYQLISPTITAPMSGTVDNLTVTPGLIISSNTTPSVLGVIKADDNHLQASVNLSEIDVVKVKPGQKVTLTLDAYPSKTFTGKVMVVNTNGEVSSNVTTYPATIQFDIASTDIYPNMAVTAQIITDIKDNTLLVPSSAVVSNNGESFIRVLKDNNISNVPVQTGNTNDTQTEIISGIDEGTVVVTSIQNPSNTTTTSPFSAFGNRGFGGRNGTVRIIGG